MQQRGREQRVAGVVHERRGRVREDMPAEHRGDGAIRQNAGQDRPAPHELSDAFREVAHWPGSFPYGTVQPNPEYLWTIPIAA